VSKGRNLARQAKALGEKADAANVAMDKLEDAIAEREARVARRTAATNASLAERYPALADGRTS